MHQSDKKMLILKSDDDNKVYCYDIETGKVI